MTTPLIDLVPPPLQNKFSAGSNASGIARPWEQWLQNLQQTAQANLANIASNAQKPTTQADLPSDLGESDAGSVYWVTDFNHLLYWNGSAYQWGPGENGSGGIFAFLSAPTGAGWALCDGSTVEMLNADGTTTSVTLPNYTTAAYLKLGTAASAGPNAASGLTDTVSAGTPAGTNAPVTSANESADATVQSGTGANVAASPHTHNVSGQAFTGTPLAGHAHGAGTLDLRNSVLLAYFRQ